MKRLLQFLVLAGLALAGVPTLQAQWHTQNLVLQPGWNAVYLEVHPYPGDPDLLFAQIPVESIWAWNRTFEPAQFIQDVSAPVPENPDWLMYVPSASPAVARKSLYKMLGGKSYLIKLAATAQPAQMVLVGKPFWRSPDWIRDSLNLTGFSLPPASPPTFQSYYGPITNLNSGPVYRLQSSGAWAQVALTAAMRSGEACWTRMNGRVDFAGPLRITLEQSSGIDFGRTLQEQTVVIRNESSAARTIVVRTLLSEQPPSPDLPALAGSVPLSYWVTGSTNFPGWTNLPAMLTRSNLATGAEWSLRLAVRRADMVPYGGPVGSAGVLYQSLFEVTDSAGLSRSVLPVTAWAASSRLARKATKDAQGAMPLQPGLWVGNVVLNKVSQPASFTPLEPQPTSAPFPFRVLVHKDTNGTVRLLQKVLQMWQDGTLKPDPNDPSMFVVDQPGHFVLLTDESLVSQIPGLNGATLRDGTPVGRRFSTSAFGFRTPKNMSVAGDTLSCTITLDYDDPVNPFKHLYHPDHDNLDERFEEKLPEGVESLTVTRQIQLQFTASDPEGLLLAGWGDNQLGGIYQETVAGLHQATIYASGWFRLHRASSTPVLNNGL